MITGGVDFIGSTLAGRLIEGDVLNYDHDAKSINDIFGEITRSTGLLPFSMMHHWRESCPMTPPPSRYIPKCLLHPSG